MKTTTRIEDIRGAATLCIKCGNCTYAAWPLNYPLCPIYTRDRCYTHSAGGLLYLVLALLNKAGSQHRERLKDRQGFVHNPLRTRSGLGHK